MQTARGSQEVGCTQPFGDELALQSRRGKARGKATSMKTIKRAKWPNVKGNKVARLNWGWVEFATFLGDTEAVVKIFALAFYSAPFAVESGFFRTLERLSS